MDTYRDVAAALSALYTAGLTSVVDETALADRIHALTTARRAQIASLVDAANAGELRQRRPRTLP